MKTSGLNLSLVSAAILLLGSTMLNTPAHAYGYYTCDVGDTDIVRWKNKNLSFRAGANSFPKNSTTGNALELALSRWNEAPGNFSFGATAYGDSSVKRGNGQSEAWFTSDTEIAPTGAKTYFYFSCATGKMKEADIVFLADPDTNKDDGVNIVWSYTNNRTTKTIYNGVGLNFGTAALHEMGHSLGLAHENREYNIMGSDQTHVATNGNVVRHYAGEDAGDGEIFLYGTTGNSKKEDVGVSHWQYDSVDGEYSTHKLGRIIQVHNNGSGVLPSTYFEGVRRYNVHKNVEINPEFTFENNGATTQNVKIGFYISSNEKISTIDRLIKSQSIKLTRGNASTIAYPITIPADLVSGQTYWLGVIVDIDGKLSEFTEANNATYIPIRVE